MLFEIGNELKRVSIFLNFRNFEMQTFKGVIYLFAVLKEQDYGKNKRYYGINVFFYY